VGRDFVADAPNILWVPYIAFIPKWEGFLYPAVTLDVSSSRVVSCATESYLRTQLVLRPPELAPEQCRPRSVTHHWDQGC